MKFICGDQIRSKIRIALHMSVIMLTEHEGDQNKGSELRQVHHRHG